MTTTTTNASTLLLMAPTRNAGAAERASREETMMMSPLDTMTTATPITTPTHQLEPTTNTQPNNHDSNDDVVHDDDEVDESPDDDPHWRWRANLATQVSLFANIMLLCTNVIAFALSLSLALLATTLDSVLDLISQIIIMYAMRGNRNVDKVRWPLGRARLEPVGIMLVAALMGIAAFQVVFQSIIAFTVGPKASNGRGPQVGMVSVGLLVAGITVKFALYMLCRSVAKYSTSIGVLAEDHRNDVLANSVAISSALIASHVDDAWFVDPLGAIVISLYICYRWISVARQQTPLLVGRTASPRFLKRVERLAARHHPQMMVDVVRAYHFGPRLLVEVEVVVPPESSIVMAHDEALTLQKKIETLPQVERAFVHVDYALRDEDEHEIKFTERERRSHGGSPSGSGSGLRKRAPPGGGGGNAEARQGTEEEDDNAVTRRNKDTLLQV